MGVRTTGDLFHHRYYRINEMLLKLTGLWPHQSIRTRFVITTFIFVIVTSGMLPQVVVVGKHLNDWNFLVESVSSLTFDGSCITKFVISTLNRKNVGYIFFHVLSKFGQEKNRWVVKSNDKKIKPFLEVLHIQNF